MCSYHLKKNNIHQILFEHVTNMIQIWFEQLFELETYGSAQQPARSKPHHLFEQIPYFLTNGQRRWEHYYKEFDVLII